MVVTRAGPGGAEQTTRRASLTSPRFVSSAVTECTQCPRASRQPADVMAQFPVSGPDQAGDGLRRLADLRGRHLAALGGSLGYAVPQMVFHQAQRHRLQRPGRRRYLGQDVDAVLV